MDNNTPNASAPPSSAAPSSLSRPSYSAPVASSLRRLNGKYDNEDLSNIDMPSHWAVPWSDLMMVMMVMFAVMLATNLAERDVSELFKKDTNPQPKAHLQPPPEKETPTQAKPQADIRSNQQTETQPKPALDQPKAPEPPVPESNATPAKLETAEQGAIPIQDILRLSKNLVTDAKLEDIDVILTDNQSVKVSVRGNLLFDLGKADLKPEAVTFLRELSKIIAANNYQIEVAGHTDNFPVSNPAYPTNWELSSARAARVARYLIQFGKLEPGRFTVIGHSMYQPSAANDSLANKAKNRRVDIIITRYEYKP